MPPLTSIDRDRPAHASADHDDPIMAGDPVAARMPEWIAIFRPVTEHDLWLVTLMVVESIRLDGLHDREWQLRAFLIRRATQCWDLDRQIDAETLGATLAKKPGLVARRLEATRHGCEWLLERWKGLGRVLHATGEWTEAQSALAFDLLGVAGDVRVGTPWGESSTPGALVAREVERLERRKAESLDRLDAFQRELAVA